jgi:hypothetical protein
LLVVGDNTDHRPFQSLGKRKEPLLEVNQHNH